MLFQGCPRTLASIIHTKCKGLVKPGTDVVGGRDDRKDTVQASGFRHGAKPILQLFSLCVICIMQGVERMVYQYRFYPTDDQARELARILGCVRYVYNWGLALRTEAWFEHHERIDDAETDRLLVRTKRDPEKSWLAEVSCVPLHKAQRHLNAAFVHFFAGRVRYPRFHRMHNRQSATYQVRGFRWKAGTLTLAQMNAPLDIRWTRPVGAQPTSVTVRKAQAGRSFVSFATEEDVTSLPEVNVSVDLGLGLLDTVVWSTGEKEGNERFFRRDEKRLAQAQRSLARQQKGPRNRTKAQRKVVRIAGVGWGELLRQLEYKARWFGRTFVRIDRFYPSRKRCHAFRHSVDHLSLAVRYWECPVCGAALDRDVNAAHNIQDAGLAEWAAGLAVSACGGDDRPTRKRVGGPRRSRKPQ